MLIYAFGVPELVGSYSVRMLDSIADVGGWRELVNPTKGVIGVYS